MKITSLLVGLGLVVSGIVMHGSADAGLAPGRAGAPQSLAAGALLQQAKLTASDGVLDDRLGISVAVSGDGNTAIAGAAYKAIDGHLNQGAAYVFTRSGTSWVQQVRLIASDGAGSETFGRSVALSSDGDTAIVGAPQANISGNNYQGAAYVFTRSGAEWTQQAKLTAADGAGTKNT
jgi:hypothetical protein